MKLIPENHLAANSLTLTNGTSSSTVSDLQELNDGNIYEIIESAGTPAFNLRLMFINAIRFSGLAYKAQYEPGTHYIEVRIYNYTTGIWDIFTTITDTPGMNYRFIDILDFTPYIRESVTLLDFDHVQSGNASHRMYIDYVALVR